MSDRRRQDALVREYLRRLGWELREMGYGERDQLMAEITDHIALAREELEDPSDEQVAALLERMGTPEEVAAEASRLISGAGGGPVLDEDLEALGLPADLGAAVAPVTAVPLVGGEQELRAVSLLLAGGLLLGIGWVFGVVFLWRSTVFSTRDKVLGTAVVPGGVLPAVYVLLRPFGQGALLHLLELAVAMALPIGTSVFLHRRLRAKQVASGFEVFRARRAAHAAERARNEMGLG
jgi:hypothetical protein